MFQKLSVANKIAVGATLCIFVCFGIISFIISKQAYSYFYKESVFSVKSQLTLAIDMLSSFNIASKEAAEKMASVFIDSVGDVYVDENKLVKVGDFETPEVKANGRVLNNNFDLVDNYTKHTSGSVATVFTRKGDDFIRVSTSLKKEDGSRAFGTKLDTKHPGYAKVINGETYLGKAALFGKQYMTKYVPIKQNGKVVGILFIGFDITPAYKSLVEKIKSLKIGESGYYYAIDTSSGDKKGNLLIHPSLEGKNLLGLTDANGNLVFKDIIETKEGSLEYEWKTDDGIVDKYAAFAPFKD
ncbi:MAG: hypothetical protein RL154_665, partial [Pseudomonadota bacterium]